MRTNYPFPADGPGWSRAFRATAPARSVRLLAGAGHRSQNVVAGWARSAAARLGGCSCPHRGASRPRLAGRDQQRRLSGSRFSHPASGWPVGLGRWGGEADQRCTISTQFIRSGVTTPTTTRKRLRQARAADSRKIDHSPRQSGAPGMVKMTQSRRRLHAGARRWPLMLQGPEPGNDRAAQLPGGRVFRVQHRDPTRVWIPRDQGTLLDQLSQHLFQRPDLTAALDGKPPGQLVRSAFA